MNQQTSPALARLMANHRAALARQEAVVTHAVILNVLHELAADAITESQALRLLEQEALHISYAPARVAIYRQAMEALRALEAAEQE